jgi:Zn-dependent protease
LAGIPVALHWSVVLVALLLGSSLATTYGGLGAAVALGAFLASIVAHELAHALAARRFGVGTSEIQLWALGGVARLDRDAPTPKAEGVIAAAGPLASLAIGVVALGTALTLLATGTEGTYVSIVGWIGLINLALAVFNLLPGAPLDGGRILRAVRWRQHGDRFRAAREAGNAGKAVGWSLAGVGIVMLFNGLPGLMLVVTGAFIAISAKAESFAVDVAARLHGTRVRDLTWFGVARATTDTDADTMLWQRSRLGDAGVVAIETPTGELAGLVSEEQLWSLPESRRPMTRLSSLMVPFDRVARAELDEDLSQVLSRLNPVAPVVTVWQDGKLLGVVPRQRLMERISAAHQAA